MHIREVEEPDKSGLMTLVWAEAHDEELTLPFYVRHRDKPGKCKNPHCGHIPIYNVWVMRNEASGEVKEIGTHCHQRWLRLRGYGTDAWFNEYEANLILIGRTQRGVRISGLERRKIRKDARKTWILKQVKKGNIRPLQLIDMPLENFKTKELADEWAEEHGGYVFGDIWKHVKVGRDTRVYKIQTDTRETVRKHVWAIYVNPTYKGEY